MIDCTEISTLGNMAHHLQILQFALVMLSIMSSHVIHVC